MSTTKSPVPLSDLTLAKHDQSSIETLNKSAMNLTVPNRNLPVSDPVTDHSPVPILFNEQQYEKYASAGQVTETMTTEEN